MRETGSKPVTPEEFRRQFPALRDTTHLASCSQGAISEHVTAALSELAYSLRHRGAPWDLWMAEAEAARTAFAALIGADPTEIALVPSASAGAFQAVGALDPARRPVLVSPRAEFPSVGQVFHAQQPFGARVRWVDDEAMRRHGVVEAYRAQIDETTALVSIPFALYSNGSLQPVDEIAKLAREAGARVFVDAYQAAGVLPVDAREIDCDYLVTGSLKYLLGLPGVAFLFARAGVPDERPPHLTGWFGRVDPFDFDATRLDFPAEARRFESGTPAVPSLYAARAGLETLATLDQAEVAAHVSDLVQTATARLTAAGEELSPPLPGARPGPQVAIVDDDPEGLARFLAGRRIVTSPRGRILRLSWHYYNNHDDIDAVVAALAEARNR
ncbi:aminotransferase class V-fold PLP-dependent enzyme [Amycolatopsis alkalitolerans]|uniref:Aminotransferase class V-fold PLP-dependent enzyme n=1 Tax=Amycolatopsis alkalitolerans TaxID=2547244 RepID=A0A5C4M0F7_9PSEU|nr:aminotransferase class V-fold PLP-dependent enzyme [Amycolatopsis alkalitolerans]TNC25778.1 aminotransferase class V-fold PLP-dependent enzyme [Amycolatopsis alkalitolerans]